jgi:hypothetical protein
MFERYTEKARRTIFFARYEASHYGSPYIETEHLLLGLLREDRELARMMAPGSKEAIRKQIDAQTEVRPGVSTSVDLPLSNESKRVLAYAAEEAERLAHKYIGPEHLFLGLLREKKSFAAELLSERGVALERMREHFAKTSHGQAAGFGARSRATEATVEIRRVAHNANSIRKRVSTCREFNWHWDKRSWKPQDLAVSKDGALSFDLSLASGSDEFSVLQGGWKKDRCVICRWELLESEDRPGHSTGYTNGRDWVCTECYDKFLKGPDYFASSHPEIT